MLLVKDIMEQQVHTINPLVSVARAALIMEKYSIGCLPVVDDFGKLVGIVTSRDIRRAHPNRLIADVMTKEVITALPTISVWEAKELMEKNKIERLVIVHNETIRGIITKSEAVAICNMYIDSLTGLYKAEFFYSEIRKLLEKGFEIAVIFIDLDNFRMINKKYGHIYGDNVIHKVAQILKELSISNRDILCRYGGDEFVIATLQPLKETEKFSIHLLEAIMNEKWKFGAKITASAGIAGGRRAGVRNLNEDGYYIVKNLVNMASIASTKAKLLKKRVLVADNIEEMV